MSYTGIENDDSLSVGGRELGEEAGQLNSQATALFNAMEDEVQEAMKGAAPQELLKAHEELNRQFGSMVVWLDTMGIKLGDANNEIVQADLDSGAGLGAAGATAGGLPPINA